MINRILSYRIFTHCVFFVAATRTGPGNQCAQLSVFRRVRKVHDEQGEQRVQRSRFGDRGGRHALSTVVLFHSFVAQYVPHWPPVERRLFDRPL